MMIYDPKDINQVNNNNIPGACNSPFEYMQQQKVVKQYQKNVEEGKYKDVKIDDLQRFNYEQNINNLNNNFPK